MVATYLAYSSPFLGIGLTLWWIKAVHGETRVYIEKAQNTSPDLRH